MRLASCRIPLFILSLLSGLAALPEVSAAEYQIQLADYLNHSWHNELVTYPFSAENGKCVVDSVRLRGPKEPVPVQLVEVEHWPETQFVKSARLAFVVDDLAPLASHTYTVSYGPKEAETPQPASDLKVETTPTQLEATTSHFGVRLLVGDKTYDEPADPASVPGPIAGMRLADGTWFGGSRLFSDWRAIAEDANQSVEGKAVAQRWANDWSRISGYSAKVVAAGPALARVACEYRMVDGKTRTVTVQLAAGGDRIMITNETTRRPEPDQGLNPVVKDGWELLLHGLPPLALQYRPQQGRQQVGSVALPSGWEEREIATHPAQPFGIDWAAPSPSTPDWMVTSLAPWGVWWDEYEQTDLYLTFLDTRQAGTDSPDARELAIQRLDAGLWVTPGTSENTTYSTVPLMKQADGSLALRLSDAARMRRLTVGENPSFLARTNSNKIFDWGVMVMPDPVERLDVVKDMVLSWPEKKKNPLLFLNAEQMKAAAEREPAAMTSLQNIEQLREVIDQYEHGYRDTMRAALGAFCQYDALVNSDGVSADERTVLRARTAYLAYRLASPANWSNQHGYASGNQNMTVAHVLNKGMAGCVMPDHPLAKQWAAEPIEWMEGWMKTLDQSGHWWESADYARVSTSKFMYFAIAMHNAGLHDFLSDPRFKRMAAYYARTTLTPPDPERSMGVENHHPRVTATYGRGGHANAWGLSGLLAPYYRESDPELSKMLQWTYMQNRPNPQARPIMGEPMMGYELLIPDTTLPMQRPDWNSELLPRVGALFRGGVGTPDENFMMFVTKFATNPDGEIWPSEVGTLQLWFENGKPLTRIFPQIPLGHIYHGLLSNRVMLASNSSPSVTPPAGYIGKESQEGFAALPRVDYINSVFEWVEPWAGHAWYPAESAPAFPQVSRDGALGTTDTPVTWRRQALYVRDEEPGGKNYLVLRDGVSGGQPTQWHFWSVSSGLSAAGTQAPVPAELANQQSSPARELTGDRFTAVGKYGLDLEYYVAAPDATPRHTLRYRYDYPTSGPTPHFQHEQDLLQLRLDGDGAYFVALFPRSRDEAAPAFTTLGDGTVIKVKGEFGSDYNFLADESHKTKAEEATFNGTVASVQDRKTVLVLALADKGSVQYQAYGLAAATPVNLRVAAGTLTLTLMADHPATEVTIKAQNGWRLGEKLPSVSLREADGIYRLTIPANVRNVTLVKQ